MKMGALETFARYLGGARDIELTGAGMPLDSGFSGNTDVDGLRRGMLVFGGGQKKKEGGGRQPQEPPIEVISKQMGALETAARYLGGGLDIEATGAGMPMDAGWSGKKELDKFAIDHGLRRGMLVFGGGQKKKEGGGKPQEPPITGRVIHQHIGMPDQVIMDHSSMPDKVKHEHDMPDHVMHGWSDGPIPVAPLTQSGPFEFKPLTQGGPFKIDVDGTIKFDGLPKEIVLRYDGPKTFEMTCKGVKCGGISEKFIRYLLDRDERMNVKEVSGILSALHHDNPDLAKYTIETLGDLYESGKAKGKRGIAARYGKAVREAWENYSNPDDAINYLAGRLERIERVGHSEALAQAESYRPLFEAKRR